MKITAVSEREPYFLSKKYLDGKLKLLGSQTSGTKQLRRKKLSSHLTKFNTIISTRYSQDKTIV